MTINNTPRFGSYFKFDHETGMKVSNALATTNVHVQWIGQNGFEYLRVDDVYDPIVLKAAGWEWRFSNEPVSLDQFGSLEDFVVDQELPWYKHLAIAVGLSEHPTRRH